MSGSVAAKAERMVRPDRKTVPLGEVIKPIRPRIKPSERLDLPFIGMEHVEAHTMRLLGTVPAATMKSAAVHFQPGDVLYGRLRPYLNKVYRVAFEGLCSAEFIVFPKTEGLESRYLQYFLNSSAFVSYASHLNAGDRPRVDFDQLALHPFPLVPVDDQKRIVAEIEKQFSRLDEAVANLKRVKANVKRYRAAVLKAAVEGRLVPTEAELARRDGRTYETGEQLLGRILLQRRGAWEKQVSPRRKKKYVEPQPTDTSNLRQLADGWTWASVEQVGRLQLGRQRAPKYHAGQNMRPYLRVQNVFEARIDLSDVMEMDFPGDDFETYKLRPGDILLNEGQSPELLGRPAIYRGEVPGACFTNTLIRFQAVGPLRVEFALAVFRHYMRAGRFAEAGTITTNIAHLSLGRLTTIEFPVPPLAEQHRIVAEVDRRLSMADESEAQVEASLRRAEALRQAILKRAFEAGSGSDQGTN